MAEFVQVFFLQEHSQARAATAHNKNMAEVRRANKPQCYATKPSRSRPKPGVVQDRDGAALPDIGKRFECSAVQPILRRAFQRLLCDPYRSSLARPSAPILLSRFRARRMVAVACARRSSATIFHRRNHAARSLSSSCLSPAAARATCPPPRPHRLWRPHGLR